MFVQTENLGQENIQKKGNFERRNTIHTKRGCAARLHNLQVRWKRKGDEKEDGIGIIGMRRFASTTAMTDEVRLFYTSNSSEELCISVVPVMRHFFLLVLPPWIVWVAVLANAGRRAHENEPLGMIVEFFGRSEAKHGR